MYTLLLVIALAWSADLSPSVLLPSAAEVPRHVGETAWGIAGGYAVKTSYWDAGLQGHAVWGVSDKIAISGSIGISPVQPGVWPVLGARFLVMDRPGLRLAPFGVLVGRYRISPASMFTVTALGIAAEGGWSRVRLDASVPLVGYSSGASYPRGSTGLPGPFLLSTLEAGISFALDPHDTLRVGVLAIMPTVGWRYETARWFGEASISSLGNVGAAQLRFGVGL